MINFQKVTKTYRQTTALDEIDLDINDNKIYCLLGRNGAGKTTLLKLIAGHINASEGNILVDNKRVSTINMPSCVNFIESRASQFNISVSEMVKLAGTLQDDFDMEFAKDMVKRFKLDKNKKYKQLSFGMQTMITTLLSLASNSRVVLLDEPVLGFDAIMRERFYDLLQTSFEHNPRIIIVSTHLIDEIARVAEDIIILDEGNILITSSINDIDEKAYSLTGRSSEIKTVVKGLNVISEKTLGGFTTAYIFGERTDFPESVKLSPMRLQEFFINIVGGENDEYES
ncbi:MAG TPA: ABC transporter ATP-binding protein [Ruminiclostridium sp.]|nr:ABC transporter ATP-binding protein [Ruminiclostridium sp.]